MGESDIIFVPSITDMTGINRVSSTILHNAATAIAAMAAAPAAGTSSKPAVGLTMFGVTTTAVEERAKATPTLQVPTLWDGDTTLWESGLIADYLLSKYAERPDASPPLATYVARPKNEWADKLVLATVQTLGTAATTISQMKWSGVAFSDNEILTRSADRLPHLMKWLEDKLVNEQQGFIEGSVSVQDIFPVCHLGFIANRPIGIDPELSRFPKIEAMVVRMDERASFQANPILWWEPGVIGYADDGKTPVFDT